MSATTIHASADRLRPASADRSTMPRQSWATLYRIGAYAALASVVLIVAAVVVFLLWPPPTTIEGFLNLLQQNPVRGLLDLDLIMLTSYALLAPLYLALYIALRGTSPSLALVALTSELLGVALIISSNAAFGMLSLSGQYAAASATQRSELIAAGQALMATSIGSGFNVGYIAGAIGALLFSVIMLRDHRFSKATAYCGLVMGALMVIPATVGVVGLTLSLLSLAPTVVWLGLVAARLLRLSRAADGASI